MVGKDESFDDIKQELKRLAPSVQSFGFVNRRKHALINIVIFGLVFFFFSLAIIDNGFWRTVGLEIGLLLMSIKIAYLMHNTMKFNHYMFWIMKAFEMHLLSIQKNVNELQRSKNIDT